jgi:hypothetical protein
MKSFRWDSIMGVRDGETSYPEIPSPASLNRHAPKPNIPLPLIPCSRRIAFRLNPDEFSAPW